MTPPRSPEAPTPGYPEAPVASPSVMAIPTPVGSPGMQMPTVLKQESLKGPEQMFSGFFFGLSASFAMGVAIIGKRIYDQKRYNSGDATVELGRLQSSVTAF